MRFMMIVKASKDSEAGKMPSEELLSAMGKYNEELMKAGVLLDLSGLQPSSKGARIKFSGGKRTVLDGPFTETKELVAGYWLWNVLMAQAWFDTWDSALRFELKDVAITEAGGIAFAHGLLHIGGHKEGGINVGRRGFALSTAPGNWGRNFPGNSDGVDFSGFCSPC